MDLYYLTWVVAVAVVFLLANMVLKASEYWFVNHKVVYLKRRRRLRS